jgi:hypothetical protein
MKQMEELFMKRNSEVVLVCLGHWVPSDSAAEKTSKVYRHMSKFCLIRKMAISERVLNVFSEPGHRFELISFALCQATQGKSLEYPQGQFEEKKFPLYFTLYPSWKGLENILQREKNITRRSLYAR